MTLQQFAQSTQVMLASWTEAAKAHFFNPPSTCLDRIWDSLVHLDLQSFACFCILFLAWSSIAVHLPEHDEKSCLFGDDVFHFRDSAGMVFRGVISHLSCGRMCVAFI